MEVLGRRVVGRAVVVAVLRQVKGQVVHAHFWCRHGACVKTFDCRNGAVRLARVMGKHRSEHNDAVHLARVMGKHRSEHNDAVRLARVMGKHRSEHNDAYAWQG